MQLDKIKGAAPTVCQAWRSTNRYTLVHGKCAPLLAKLPDNSIDLILTSPPYCIGKAYERKRKAEEFLPQLAAILPDLIRVLRPGGSICWQVGYHVTNGVLTPLDYLVYGLMSQQSDLYLRNRIIWTFGHGLHNEDRFSGRHETILWFTKGDKYRFDLDAVRVLQKYPGKKHYKGGKQGKLSGNPKGKNPSDVWTMPDVWDIPNVKANHVEKTKHPCQFPVALAQRLIAALTKKHNLVLDPFAGTATTGAASALLDRRFVGSETSKKYYRIGVDRIQKAIRRELRYRPSHKLVYEPPADTPLTRVPQRWRIGNGVTPDHSIGTNGDLLKTACPARKEKHERD